MQIVWTETALRHLAAIQAYIERDKPQAAKDVAQAICRAVAYLAAHPHLGRPGESPEPESWLLPVRRILFPTKC